MKRRQQTKNRHPSTLGSAILIRVAGPADGPALERLAQLDSASPLAGEVLLAARAGMREMAARAYLYRFELGDVRALDGARVMGAEIENPALRAALEAKAAQT